MADFGNVAGFGAVEDYDFGAAPDDEDLDAPSREFEALKTCWESEIASPSILRYNDVLIPKFIELLKQQQLLLQWLKDHEIANPLQALELSLYQMEYDRVAYVVTDYLRLRLRKLERNAMFYLSDADTMALLSPGELDFLQQFANLLERHLTDSVLRHLPDQLADLRKLDSKEMIDEPNEHTFVFAEKLVQGEYPDDDSMARLEVGTVCITRFSQVKEKVLSGEIALKP